MEKLSPNDFIAIAISSFIVAAIMLLLHYLMDTWSNDQKFIAASILTIIGILILRRMRDKTRDHRLFYLTVGNVLLGVGVAILIIPLRYSLQRSVLAHTRRNMHPSIRDWSGSSNAVQDYAALENKI